MLSLSWWFHCCRLSGSGLRQFYWIMDGQMIGIPVASWWTFYLLTWIRASLAGSLVGSPVYFLFAPLCFPVPSLCPFPARFQSLPYSFACLLPPGSPSPSGRSGIPCGFPFWFLAWDFPQWRISHLWTILLFTWSIFDYKYGFIINVIVKLGIESHRLFSSYHSLSPCYCLCSSWPVPSLVFSLSMSWLVSYFWS